MNRLHLSILPIVSIVATVAGAAQVAPPAPPPPIQGTSIVVTGRISRVLTGPEGRPQGFLLRNGTFVTLSPTLAQQLPTTIGRNSSVRLSGGEFSYHGDKTIAASSLTVAGVSYEDTAPVGPPPGTPGPGLPSAVPPSPPPPSTAGQLGPGPRGPVAGPPSPCGPGGPPSPPPLGGNDAPPPVPPTPPQP